MVHTTYDEMNEILAVASAAYEYAWQHYDELNARKAVYTLYGPSSYGLGAAFPAGSTKPRERKLLKKTKRKCYTKYELDANYQVLRVSAVENDNRIDCTHHVFDFNGHQCAVVFRGDEKRFYDYCVDMIKFVDGRPAYCAIAHPAYLFLEFYQYVTDETVVLTQYGYYPTCERTSAGLLPDWDAPFNAPNSPVKVWCSEEQPRQSIDLAKWFV